MVMAGREAVMASPGIGRSFILVAGAICLVAAGLLWWTLIRDGVTLRGTLRPGMFTLIGLFWVLYGLRSGRARRPTDPPHVEH